MMDERLAAPQGEYELRRFPHREPEHLRAWDAADEYLLAHLDEAGLVGASASVLILNDGFGALAVALADHRVQSMSDSYLAHQGTLANLRENKRPADTVRMLNSLEPPVAPIDIALIKVPKSLALLEDQLHRLRPHLGPETTVIGAGMSKAIHTSTLELFETIIGPTRTSLARKKARLIFCDVDADRDPGDSPYPSAYRLEGTDLTVTSHAGVFSRESLDIGTRLFLEHAVESSGPRQIVDLGCGNGVVGVAAAARNESAFLTFLDESYMAVASARASFEAAFGLERAAEFRVADCLEGVARDSVDLVLCNPPFHQERTVGDGTAWQMFRESRAALRSTGELRVVGNRHLAYHAKLKRLFGNCEVLGSNRKFVVLRAEK